MTAPATALVFPITWRRDSCERFQRLADKGRMTQVDVNEVEAKLAWFRKWRDYYATTEGQDEIDELARAG